VGYVGRLSPEKNVAALVEAYSLALTSVRPQLRLIIIGSGPSELQLRRQARALGLEENIAFLGRRYDVPRLLQGIDIFVLPSFFEGCSNALIEAMAAGKAIVASNVPGNREVLGYDGFLFDPNNADELRNILVRLANNPRLRTKKGLVACDRAGKFDLDSVCNEFVEMITNIA
jgi:glycosyltransferase involved in cell wall biosynthesis